jgi:TusA-related sulfurtransferase
MTESQSSSGAGGRRAPSPRFFLDAGGELAAILSGSIHRCIAGIELGEVLEVISREPRSHADIVDWCRITGNELLRVTEHGNATLFWIRKT